MRVFFAAEFQRCYHCDSEQDKNCVYLPDGSYIQTCNKYDDTCLSFAVGKDQLSVLPGFQEIFPPIGVMDRLGHTGSLCDWTNNNLVHRQQAVIPLSPVHRLTFDQLNHYIDRY